MAIDPVDEDTYDKFSGTRKRESHPHNFGSTLSAFNKKTELRLGFLEEGDSATLYLYVRSNAPQWQFYKNLWVLAASQRYEFELIGIRSESYADGYAVRCVEEFTVMPIDAALLREMLFRSHRTPLFRTVQL